MTRLFVPRDALSVAVGADELAAALAQACPDATIIRNGSRGMAWLEPLLEVQTESGRIGYGPVEAADVPGLLAAGFLAGGAHPKRRFWRVRPVSPLPAAASPILFRSAIIVPMAV